MLNRRFTKTLAIATMLPLALTLGACNGGSNDAQAPGGDADVATLALSLSTQTNPFFVQLREGAQSKADEMGFQLEVLDASNDPSKQINQIDSAVIKNIKAAIINPVDSAAIAPAVKQLNDKSIPVVAVDRAAEGGEVASFVASDNIGGGKQAAEALAKAIGDKGEILVLEGIPGSSASRDRNKGFKEAIAKYPDITIVGEQTAGFDRSKGLDVATNLLQAHPKVAGIFAENDEMALGAIQALGAKAGKEVKVVGFDGTPDGVKAVADGQMAATIAQQPKLLGAQAVEQAVKLAEAQPVDAEIEVPVVTITSANVKEYQ